MMRFWLCFRLVSVADTLGAYDVYGSSIDGGKSGLFVFQARSKVKVLNSGSCSDFGHSVRRPAA
jgi:hypothetical protein